MDCNAPRDFAAHALCSAIKMGHVYMGHVERPFHELDSPRLIESYRSAWPALFEGARPALENNVALTPAG